MESPGGGGLLQSLSAVVSFLHTEGFLAAEETLLREIEHRYPAPDAVSPRHTAASPGSSGGGATAQQQRRQQAQSQQQQQQQPAATGGGNTLDFQPALAAAQCLTPAESMESAEK